MKQIDIYKINWNLIKRINHETFGEGKLKYIFYKNFDNIKIPFVTIEYKDFECLYIVGDWESFYNSYSSIKVNLKLGSNLHHIRYGKGTIKEIKFINDKPYVVITFNSEDKLFSPANITSEYFDIDTLPLFDNTYKEHCNFTKSSDLYLDDARRKYKHEETNIFLYRIVVGGGKRGYEYLNYDLKKDHMIIHLDKMKNKQINYCFDPYPQPKNIYISNFKEPSLSERFSSAGDTVWNNQQRRKDKFLSSSNDDNMDEMKEYAISHSRSEHTGWFYSDED